MLLSTDPQKPGIDQWLTETVTVTHLLQGHLLALRVAKAPAPTAELLQMGNGSNNTSRDEDIMPSLLTDSD
jgi:hypothetical protein